MKRTLIFLVLLILLSGSVFAEGAKEHPKPAQQSIFFSTDGTWLAITTTGGEGIKAVAPQVIRLPKDKKQVTFTITSDNRYFAQYPKTPSGDYQRQRINSDTGKNLTETVQTKQVNFFLSVKGNHVFLWTPDKKAKYKYPLYHYNTKNWPGGTPSSRDASSNPTAPPFDKPPVTFTIKQKQNKKTYCVDKITSTVGSSIKVLPNRDPSKDCPYTSFSTVVIFTGKGRGRFQTFNYKIKEVTGTSINIRSATTGQEYTFSPENPITITSGAPQQPTLFDYLKNQLILVVVDWRKDTGGGNVLEVKPILSTNHMELALVPKESGEESEPTQTFEICGQDLASPLFSLQIKTDEKLHLQDTNHEITVQAINTNGGSPYLIFRDSFSKDSSSNEFEVFIVCKNQKSTSSESTTQQQTIKGTAKIEQTTSTCEDNKPCEFQLSIQPLSTTGPVSLPETGPVSLPEYCIAGIWPQTLQGKDENSNSILRWIGKCDALKKGITKTLTFENIQSPGIGTPEFFLYPIKDSYPKSRQIKDYFLEKDTNAFIPATTSQIPRIASQFLYKKNNGGDLITIEKDAISQKPLSPAISFDKGKLSGTITQTSNGFNLESQEKSELSVDLSGTNSKKPLTLVKYQNKIIFALEPLNGFTTAELYFNKEKHLLSLSTTRARVFVPQEYTTRDPDLTTASVVVQKIGSNSLLAVFALPQTQDDDKNDFCLAGNYDLSFKRDMTNIWATRVSVLIRNSHSTPFCTKKIDSFSRAYPSNVHLIKEKNMVPQLVLPSVLPAREIVASAINGFTPYSAVDGSGLKYDPFGWSTTITLDPARNTLANHHVTLSFADHPALVVGGYKEPTTTPVAINVKTEPKSFAMHVTTVDTSGRERASGSTLINEIQVILDHPASRLTPGKPLPRLSVNPTKGRWIMTVGMPVNWGQRSFRGIRDLFGMDYSQEDRERDFNTVNKLTGNVVSSHSSPVASFASTYGSAVALAGSAAPTTEATASTVAANPFLYFPSTFKVVYGPPKGLPGTVTEGGVAATEAAETGTGVLGGVSTGVAAAGAFAAASLGNLAYAWIHYDKDDEFTMGQAPMSEPFPIVIGGESHFGFGKTLTTSNEAVTSMKKIGVKRWFLLPTSRYENTGEIMQATGKVLASGKNDLTRSDFSSDKEFNFYKALTYKNGPKVSSESDCELFAQWYAFANPRVVADLKEVKSWYKKEQLHIADQMTYRSGEEIRALNARLEENLREKLSAIQRGSYLSATIDYIDMCLLFSQKGLFQSKGILGLGKSDLPPLYITSLKPKQEDELYWTMIDYYLNNYEKQMKFALLYKELVSPTSASGSSSTVVGVGTCCPTQDRYSKEQCRQGMINRFMMDGVDISGADDDQKKIACNTALQQAGGNRNPCRWSTTGVC